MILIYCTFGNAVLILVLLLFLFFSLFFSPCLFFFLCLINVSLVLYSTTQVVFRVWRIIKSNLLEEETSVWTENLINVYFKLTAVVTLALLIMLHINKLYIQTAVTLVSVVNFISYFTVEVEVFIIIHCTVRNSMFLDSFG